MVVDVVVVVDDAVRPIPMAACGRGRTKAALRRGRWCISNVIIIDDDRVAAAKAATVVAAMRISISAAGAWGVLLGLPWNLWLWLWLWRYHQLCGRYYESSAGRIARPSSSSSWRVARRGVASEIEGSCWFVRQPPNSRRVDFYVSMSGLGSVIETDRRMG